MVKEGENCPYTSMKHMSGILVAVETNIIYQVPRVLQVIMVGVHVDQKVTLATGISDRTYLFQFDKPLSRIARVYARPCDSDRKQTCDP